MSKQIILGVRINDRVKNAQQIQHVLTEYGCNIKTRLGLHDVDENACSTNGILLLEMFGNESKINEAETKLRQVEGVDVQKMEFDV